jgi:hypothetical protein
VAGEELRHIRSRSGLSGEGADSRPGEDEAQCALMLVEGHGLKSLLDRGTDDERVATCPPPCSTSESSPSSKVMISRPPF